MLHLLSNSCKFQHILLDKKEFSKVNGADREVAVTSARNYKVWQTKLVKWVESKDTICDLTRKTGRFCLTDFAIYVFHWLFNSQTFQYIFLDKTNCAELMKHSKTVLQGVAVISARNREVSRNSRAVTFSICWNKSIFISHIMILEVTIINFWKLNRNCFPFT